VSIDQIPTMLTPEVLAQLATSVCTICGMYLVGKRKTYGWLFTIANGAGWAVLLWFSGQYIMYVPLTIMTGVAVANYRRWRQEDRANEFKRSPEPGDDVAGATPAGVIA